MCSVSMPDAYNQSIYHEWYSSYLKNNLEVIGNSFCTNDVFFISVDTSLSTALPPNFTAPVFVIARAMTSKARKRRPRLCCLPLIVLRLMVICHSLPHMSGRWASVSHERFLAGEWGKSLFSPFLLSFFNDQPTAKQRINHGETKASAAQLWLHHPSQRWRPPTITQAHPHDHLHSRRRCRPSGISGERIRAGKTTWTEGGCQSESYWGFGRVEFTSIEG